MHVIFFFYDVILYVRSIFVFKQKTAYEMRISDWSSDVCSSDLTPGPGSTNGYWMPRPGRPSAPTAATLRGLAGTAERAWQCRTQPASIQEIGRASCRERVCQYV